MASDPGYRPTHQDPLFILAMDHRGSFGKTLFEVQNDEPSPAAEAAMKAAKQLIFDGLRSAVPQLAFGRAGVLVDEQYGQGVVDQAAEPGTIVLAVPVEASGHDWFTLQWGDQWLDHIERIKPAYAKVLVRDNPDFDAGHRSNQFAELGKVAAGLAGIDVPLLYELLVPATDAQLERVHGDAEKYDRELRPELVAAVIADNQAHGIEPALWKVEGLETVEATQQVADQATAGGRAADLIVLGRDAPTERLDHWLEVASQVPRFVGFAIGRSIWEDVIRDWVASDRGEAAGSAARDRICARYLGFTRHWQG